MKTQTRLKKQRSMILIMGIIIAVLISTNLFSFLMYQESIKVGAKKIVTALEMVVACQSVSNITQEQLVDEYYKIFIKPKFNGTGTLIGETRGE